MCKCESELVNTIIFMNNQIKIVIIILFFLLTFTSRSQNAFSFYPFKGYYQYYLTDSYGTFSVKNDFIYTQLSYIHTFNWQKAKKYLKKQDFSFSSKKERRKKIIEMLNVW